jgi:hypothetical protein
MDQQHGSLTIEARRSASVSEVSAYLIALEEAYNNLYTVDLIVRFAG